MHKTEQASCRRVMMPAEWLGILIALITLAGYWGVPALVRQPLKHVTGDVFYLQAIVRFYVALLGCFFSALLLAPVFARVLAEIRERERRWFVPLALVAICLFLTIFLVAMGRRQFGGYDYNLMIDLGWRQLLGQRPYVDFVTTTPPGFNLGIEYAYRIFGARWDANLYLSAMFACATFLWMYWQMTVLALGRLAAMTMAFAVETAAMLTLCFWWYNNSALVLAAVFFLACLVFARNPASRGAQISYYVALTMLSLMKPNIAGVTIAGGVLLLLLMTTRRWSVLGWTAGAMLTAVVLLKLDHVSLSAMMSSYRSVAMERGGLNAKIGFRALSFFMKVEAIFWIALLAIPVPALYFGRRSKSLRMDSKAIALSLFLLLGLAIAIYGLMTNGEFVEVECTVLLASGGVIVFGMGEGGSRLRRVYVAVLAGTVVATLSVAVNRTRVYTIGPHMFFEWQDHDHRIEEGYLKNMRVSSTMIEVERQVGAAEHGSAAPYFFGPRLDFNYAVLGLEPPRHLPLWWQPGTAFGRSAEHSMLMEWEGHHFETLIFLKDDYTFYSQEFQDEIGRSYRKDEEYPLLTVYRRR